VKCDSWTTDNVGELIQVIDKKTAIDAINTIVSQGEGASNLSPMDIEREFYAHFFKFEEIYCGRHIEH
jgi:hypothetical protein